MKTDELRELEVWIGEHIFGGEITKTPHLATDVYMQTESDRRLMMSPYPVPRYTTDRAAAMEVLEKCCDKIGILELGRVKVKPFNFCIRATYVPELDVEAETLPLAICLFAKKLYEDKS